MGMMMLQARDGTSGQQARSGRGDEEGIQFIKDGGYTIREIGNMTVSAATGATPITDFAKVMAELKNASAEVIYVGFETVTGETNGYPILPGETILVKRMPELYFVAANTVLLHYAIIY